MPFRAIGESMQTQLNIRPIRAAEAPIAKALVFRVAHEMMEPETPFESFRTLWDSWGVFDDLHDIAASYELKDGAFLVAEDAGAIVGTGAILRYEQPGYCELKRIALLPEYRGHGHGYALVRALIGEAQRRRYRAMILWTNRFRLTRAIALYQQMGFVEVPHQGADSDEIWMEQDLTCSR